MSKIFHKPINTKPADIAFKMLILNILFAADFKTPHILPHDTTRAPSDLSSMQLTLQFKVLDNSQFITTNKMINFYN